MNRARALDLNYCDIVPHDKEDGSGDEVLHNQNVNVGECVDKLCSIFIVLLRNGGLESRSLASLFGQSLHFCGKTN